jgi:CubicO group peptidase (beta-lactamase class C family)
MEYNGLWSTDHEDGLEKTFCCIGARARDFAKLGLLYLNNGSWNGHQIVAENWVRQSTKVDTTEGSAWNYQYQWWIASKDGNAYFASGHRRQYIYINRSKHLVIVRLGKKRTLTTQEWLEIFSCLVQQL